MRTPFYFQNCLPLAVSLLFLLSLNLPQLAAQDPAVQSIDVPPPLIYANQTTPISVTLVNQSTMPANNILVQIQVQNNMAQQVFFFQTSVPMIPPFGTVQVSTLPNQWYPNPPGAYVVICQITSPGDVNLSNNNMNKPAQAIPQPSIGMGQVDMVHPYDMDNSLFGVFSVNFPPQLDKIYINAMAQMGSGATLWVVRNLPLLPFPEEQTLLYWFDLSVFGLDEGDDLTALNVAIRLDPLTLASPFAVTQFQPIELSDPDFDVLCLNPETVVLTPPPAVNFPVYSSTSQLTWTYRGCTVPNIDLDSTAHPPSAGYSGDWNACGPAAAANSMQWLEDTHPNIPDNGLTHRQKMQSLSGHMGGNTNGVTTQALVQGKLAYIDEHKLPIHVKYQSVFDTAASIASPNSSYGHSAENKGGVGTRTPPTWEFLKSEMEKGEDVEIMFGWYDNAGVRHGGHWVTVTGVSENANFKGIYIKHDTSQAKPGGTIQGYHNWVTDGPWSRLLGFSGPNNNCWVESVVSESYDPTITFLAFDFKLDLIAGGGSFFSPDPSQSLFTFSFPPSLDTGYLNVTANLPDLPPIWVARNVLLPPRDTIESLSLWLDLADLGHVPGQPLDTVELKIGVDSNVWNTAFFDVFYQLPVDVDTIVYRIGNGSLESNPVAVPFFLPPPLLFDSLLPTTFIYRGCEVPNIDLDSTSMNPVTMPGYAGDKNACGPAAAANSLQWLENTDPNIPATGTTHREKLKELSEMMDRANNGGVLRTDFIEAKLEFIDKHKLPIKVKFQGWYFGTADIPSPDTLYGHSADNQNAAANADPTWAWLVQEMEDDEDVEVEFGYYDENGVRQGGHWITATGVTEVGGVRTLYFKDDTDQKAAGGMRHQCTRWVTDGGTGISYFPDLSGSDYIVVVESVVSESYDPTVEFCPDDLTLDLPAIASGTYEASSVIYVNGTIPSGSTVTLSAPSIIFQANAQVDAGAVLTTNSAGCN